MKTLEQCWPSDEMAQNANGGTQMMLRALWDKLTPEEREAVQIIPSRVREVATDRPVLLWLHDLAEDPESEHLIDDDLRKRFARLVFVSNWQFERFRERYGLLYRDSDIMYNAIEPIAPHEKPSTEDGFRFIYHTTPHRGLQLLVPVIEYLVEKRGLKIHLDVFSSFAAYGWHQRDEPFKDVFDHIRSKPYMTYYGYQPNDVVREALTKAHFFAYPSIWQETSCIAAIEAMAAGCEVIVPNYGALTETCAPFSTFYHWDENPQVHAGRFAGMIQLIMEHYHDSSSQRRRASQVDYVNGAYGWRTRIAQWKGLIRAVLDQKHR